MAARLNVGDVDSPVERKRLHAVDVQLMFKLDYDFQLLINDVVSD